MWLRYWPPSAFGGVALGVVAVATFVCAPWWQPVAYVTIVLSIVLCLVGWADARAVVLANLVILLAICFGTRVHWLRVASGNSSRTHKEVRSGGDTIELPCSRKGPPTVRRLR
jgi:hypothetical protein